LCVLQCSTEIRDFEKRRPFLQLQSRNFFFSCISRRILLVWRICYSVSKKRAHECPGPGHLLQFLCRLDDFTVNEPRNSAGSIASLRQLTVERDGIIDLFQHLSGSANCSFWASSAAACPGRVRLHPQVHLKFVLALLYQWIEHAALPKSQS